MRDIILFCMLIGIVFVAVMVLDIIAIKKSRRVSLERPDLITLEEE